MKNFAAIILLFSSICSFAQTYHIYEHDDASANLATRPRYSLDYKVTATNAANCVATDDVHVEVIREIQLQRCLGGN